MRVDAHQHFWTIARGDYGWLSPKLAPIYRDFAPRDLEPLLNAAGISRTILVQAAPTPQETDFLLELAAQTSFVAGVVGWIDLESDAAVLEVERRAAQGRVLGVRPMIQDIADESWMLNQRFGPVFDALGLSGLRFDALVKPAHLANLRKLLERHPDLRAVIDHCAKPDIARGGFKTWADEIRRIARNTNAFCKLSGLVTEAGAHWQRNDLAAYVEVVVDAFGPDRLMWGSDWPVVTLACDYARWLDDSEVLLSGLSRADRANIMGGTAVAFYGLEAS